MELAKRISMGMFQSSSILRGRRRSSVFVLLPKNVRLLPITADGKAARWLNVGLKRWMNEKYTEQLDIGTPILHVQSIYIQSLFLNSRLAMDQFVLFGDSITQHSFSQQNGFAFGAALSDEYVRRLDVIK